MGKRDAGFQSSKNTSEKGEREKNQNKLKRSYGFGERVKIG